MKKFTYLTHGTCSSAIDISLEGDTICGVHYHGGCSGNTQGIAALVCGMKAEDAIRRLSGIRCGMKSTSCPDQLAKALREYLNKN